MKNRLRAAAHRDRFFAHKLAAFSFALVVMSSIFWLAQAYGCDTPTARSERVSRKQSHSRPDTSEILSDIKSLASDKLEGRGTGQRGGELAASFIADEFKKTGLRPAGGPKSYFQFFDATVGVHMGKDNSLKVAFPQGESTYVADRDFIPFSFSSVGIASGPVTLAGYGISSEHYGYDDYSKESPQGKIVLVMRHEPQEQDEKSVFAGKELTHYSDLRYKATNAREHGASAIIITADPLNHPDEEDELLPLQSLEGLGDCGIPAIQVKERVAEAILRAGDFNLEDLQRRIDSLLVPVTIQVPSADVSLRVDLVKEKKKVANVVGVIEPSRGNPTEYVVVGAHYDHLGTSSQFSLSGTKGVHNGADDNASGVAAMLELARIFSAKRDSLKRGIVFVGFVGEEIGVLGSTFYASNPVVPLDKTALMLNLDMVGRMRDHKLYAAGTGSSPILKGLLARANEKLNLQIASTESGFGGSDHFTFYAHNVPVLFFFTGAHEDYHKVTDDWGKINVDGIASVVRLSAHVLSEIVFSETPVPFTRAAADTAGPPGGEGYGAGRGAYFGIVPDFGGEPDKGAKISGVSEGSPAEEAGLKAGDVIVQFAGKTITGLYDLSFALKEEKPGDEVEVIVVRDGARITFKARLGKRGAK
ncbi:MAG: M20/M25/M40 family metallo-hydrolase [Candidatus Eisenbacteria bacterium]|nr:M20/M25/M40 family metallo-hydrolase [Candidatus Eisenbacteria bacterium]